MINDLLQSIFSKIVEGKLNFISQLQELLVTMHLSRPNVKWCHDRNAPCFPVHCSLIMKPGHRGSCDSHKQTNNSINYRIKKMSVSEL